MGQPDLAPLVRRALAHHRLVRYDERGNGMSQRDVPDVSFDTWVRDLETVVDAAGSIDFRSSGSPWRFDRYRVRGEASGARHAPGALRRVRGGNRTTSARPRSSRRGARSRVCCGLGGDSTTRRSARRSPAGSSRGDAAARAVVRRTPACVHVAGKRGAPHGTRRRHRCSTPVVAGEDADARHSLRS